MSGVENFDTEVMPGTVSGLGPFVRWNRHHFFRDIDDEAGAKGFVAPEEADEIVVFGPEEEGVVGGVEVHNSATLLQVVEEVPLDDGRPADAVFEVAAVEVVDDNLVVREVGVPLSPLIGSGFAGWASGDVDRELASALEG